MPPSSSQKGTGKKGAGAIGRQRSRNTTPLSSVPPVSACLPAIEEFDTEYLEVAAKLHLFRPITYDDLVDPSPTSAPIPDSKTLEAVIQRLRQFGDLIEKRSRFNDFAVRAIAQLRSQELQHTSHAESSGQKGSATKKKRKATKQPTERSPSHHHYSKNPRKYGRTAEIESSGSSLSPTGSPSGMKSESKGRVEEDSESSSEDDGRPPERAKPQSQTFGEDPATFPDPTVYEIRDVTPGMADGYKKEIYSVAAFPRSDLADLIAGDPPDKDFSSTKPTNQISFSTFSTYVEPFFRPFNDEDLAFLRERSDRVSPFIVPKRGKKYYAEIWAEEEGAMNIDSLSRGEKLHLNQPRGSIENLDDDLAETDKLSLPPLMSRLLAAMRPENRGTPAEEKLLMNGANGSDSVVNGGDLDTAMADPPPPAHEENRTSLPPATCIPEFNMEAFKKGTSARLDYDSVDERLKLELQHVGLLGMEDEDAEYDAQYDDEVCARLRLLQNRLRQQTLVNGARKARLTELVKERMAFQEYTTILEDLDTQVQSAYLKRTRTIGKSKKKSRPGAAAPVQNTARPGIGDLTKTLMERRKRWIDNIGPVFDGETLTKVPRATERESSIFKESLMKDYVKKEQQAWDEEAEEE